ncbi:4-alpha-glucanotransferase dpe2 [Tritrichomonas musculus]|uniref:4-alpha-glucanotransferase n=1 Tax=Tritrichomonas musculus TaxID=1915356 RepID=A0ABR2IBK8_9EUKA
MITLNFHLKAPKQSNYPVFVFGNIPELGNGDPNNGIQLSKHENNDSSSYSLFLETKAQDLLYLDKEIWYSYCYKSKFGAIIIESCPKRYFMPDFSALSFYDTFDVPSSIGGVIVRFRVRFETKYGQQLFICGDSKELGDWKPEKSVPLEYSNEDGGYWACTIKFPLSDQPRSLRYKYIVFTSPKNYFWESQEDHCFEIGPSPSPSIFEVIDVYHFSDSIFEIYSLDPFVKVINRRPTSKQPLVFTSNNTPDTIKIDFTVYAPHVKSNQVLCLIGSAEEIGYWDTKRAYILNDSEFPLWKGSIVFKNTSMPIEYKYVLVNKMKSDEALYEQGFNRRIPSSHFHNTTVDKSFPISMIVNDWYTNPNTDLYRGFGISTALYSLKTENSCGIGQYTDLIPLVDYCNKIGSSLIHILPVNDTSSSETGEWEDSNPFNIISGHALHPIYIDLLAIKGVPHEILLDIHQKIISLEAPSKDPTQMNLNRNEFNYPSIYKYKIKMLHIIYKALSSSLADNAVFKNFVNENIDWLQRYAIFCHFRDKYGTKNFKKWPQFNQSITEREIKVVANDREIELLFYYWIQFICHSQLLSAKEYAENHNVVLKGEVPLLTPFQSVCVWTKPNLFNVEMRAGTLPTERDLSCILSNCPSMNWKTFGASRYELWVSRIKRMSNFFHIIQIDDSNSVFRFWESNHDQCTHSLLGHFNPALPISKSELRGNGLLDIDRYMRPYIRWGLIKDKFGTDAELIASAFFNHSGASIENQIFAFKVEFNTERKIKKAINYIFEKNNRSNTSNAIPSDYHGDQYPSFASFNSGAYSSPAYQCLDNLISSSTNKREIWEKGLLELLDNVLFVEDPYKSNHYHPRGQLCIEKIIPDSRNSNNSTSVPNPSWDDLPKEKKDAFSSLFIDFVYHRQKELWRELSQPKIKAIKSASNVLLCTDNVDRSNEFPDIFYGFNILTSRLQRIPRYFGLSFDKVREYPYLSVATPSTLTMASLREWWEEDSHITAEFWKNEIWRTDEPPSNCEPWIQEIILKQHLSSQSMWAVFMLQDLLSIDERYRPTDPNDERITPAISTIITHPDNQHAEKWCKRMKFSIENLNEADDFCYRIRTLVAESHRI